MSLLPVLATSLLLVRGVCEGGGVSDAGWGDGGHPTHGCMYSFGSDLIWGGVF